MKAATWHGKRDLRVDEVPDPSANVPEAAIHGHHDPTLTVGRSQDCRIVGTDQALANHGVHVEPYRTAEQGPRRARSRRA